MFESIPYSVVVIAAVALSAACVLAALLHRFGRIVPERGAAPLLVLAVAAVLYGGTKPGSGTNAPPLLSGIFAPRGGSVTAFTDEQLAAGFALAEARTSETHDFMPPPGAVVHEPWRRRGAHEDFISIPATNWSFPWGTATVSRATVLSSGEIGFDGGYSVSNRIAPFAASLGIVPEANWPLLGNGATNSLFWHAATSDVLTLTWLNALLDRDTDSSVSFQASLHRSGDFIFRYDLPAALALYNFPPSQLSQSSQLSRPASSPFAGAFANGFGEAYANGPATTLRWASLAGLANDADFDGDGISDADEVFAYHTNPRMADTDGDFIDDSFEIGLGTSPCRFDSDGDGLSDDIDPDPVVPCSSSAFGFSDEWIEATFGEEDGTAIKAMGFENYAGNLFANDTDGRIYLLEAHVDSLADDGRAEIVVGRYHVVVDSTGTYVFPLERGTYYLLSANPAAGVVFSTDDPAATISPHSMYRRGGVFNPLAALAVTPGECHFSYQWQTQTFSASRVAVASDDGDIWTWSCDNPNVRIVSPGQSQTDIQWTGPVVPWNAVEVQVRYSGTGVSRIGTNFWITVGDHVEPRANISIDAPNAVFLNDDDDDLDGTPDLEESLTANDDDDLQPITVSVSLEDPRWGAGEISIFPKNANTPGLSFWSDRKKTREVSLPVTMETDRRNGASQYTFFAEGSALRKSRRSARRSHCDMSTRRRHRASSVYPPRFPSARQRGKSTACGRAIRSMIPTRMKCLHTTISALHRRRSNSRCGTRRWSIWGAIMPPQTGPFPPEIKYLHLKSASTNAISSWQNAFANPTCVFHRCIQQDSLFSGAIFHHWRMIGQMGNRLMDGHIWVEKSILNLGLSLDIHRIPGLVMSA